MRILLTPIGSAGDVHPFIGVGRELKRRGHLVAVYTNDYFKPLVDRAGLEFVASSCAESFRTAADDPRLWHPTRGFEFLSRRFFLPLMPLVYRWVESRYIPGETIVVGPSLAWGARIASEKLGVPLVTLHLQPSVFFSVEETPVYGGVPWAGRLPKFLRKGYLALAGRITDGVVAPEINAFRATLGLPGVRRVLAAWTLPSEKPIGLFPDWFAAPQADWPAGTRLAGFPLDDAEDLYETPSEVEAFLRAGPSPVVFTAGSAMRQAAAMFRVSAEACERLGCRGLLVNAFEGQLPSRLPSGVLATNYVPFGRVFGRAAAVVHHGGIGTTAQALAGGAPQLVTPFAYDQFDNASRVERLGVGKTVLPGRYKLAAVTGALRRLLGNPETRARASALRERSGDRRAVSRACDWILRAGAPPGRA